MCENAKKTKCHAQKRNDYVHRGHWKPGQA